MIGPADPRNTHTLENTSPIALRLHQLTGRHSRMAGKRGPVSLPTSCRLMPDLARSFRTFQAIGTRDRLSHAKGDVTHS